MNKATEKTAENKKRLSIGLFNDSFFPLMDGVLMVVDNYARRMSKENDVTVFVPREGKKFDDSAFPYKVVRCLCVKLPLTDYYLPLPWIDFKFSREIRKANLDVVHLHSPFAMGRVALSYAKKHSIPVIGSMHSQFRLDFERTLKSEKVSDGLTKSIISVFDKCDECWAVNSEVARIYYEDYHCRDYPQVANNATDMLPVSDPAASRARIRAMHGLAEDEVIFLFVGRINKLKNVFFLADSVKRLKETGPFPFRMLFVGSGQDEDDLRHYVRKLGVEDKVTFCGKVTDRALLADYYAAADLFLFPSLYDASSIVQIEAASQSTPAVFIRGAATAATVTDGVNGFLADNDAEKFADEVASIVSDRKRLAEVGANAFRDIYVNWDDCVDGVLKKYRTLIAKKASAKRAKK